MREETLHSTARPLLAFLTLYGVNWRSERRPGKRFLNLFQLFLFVSVGSIHVIKIIAWKFGDHIRNDNQSAIVLVNCFSVLYCSLRWRPLTLLINLFKTCEMNDRESKEFRKIRRLLWLFFCLPIVVTGMSFFNWKYFPEQNECAGLVAWISGLVTWIFGCATILVFSLIKRYLYLSLPAICALICLVAYYVKMTLERSIEGIKRCESPLRRAKMATKLIKQCDQFFRLAKATNAFGTPLMLALKYFTSFVFFIRCYKLVETFDDMRSRPLLFASVSSSVVILPYALILMLYLKVALSVNQMPSKVCSALVKSMMERDQWLSCDPISRPFLLRIRVDHLVHLTHLTLHQPPLTIYDEPVKDEDIFILVFAVIDAFFTVQYADMFY